MGDGVNCTVVEDIRIDHRVWVNTVVRIVIWPAGRPQAARHHCHDYQKGGSDNEGYFITAPAPRTVSQRKGGDGT